MIEPFNFVEVRNIYYWALECGCPIGIEYGYVIAKVEDGLKIQIAPLYREESI